ncbi:Thoeris anti-defense Tad2 family protein [Pantoea eucrina]|jgi:hypothetical protein|uniref:Thoeris anti-defense Tad2 family protein n=1 Tax=Pantoea eucrina TaxID=472693 RepID=UPI000535DC32|nr:hypothetical protein PSNIH1_18965 [Pantoea sp. PSNIH1]
MSDIPHAPPPAAYLYCQAISIICENAGVICRRARWGNTPRHVSFQADAQDLLSLIFMNESGRLSVYVPSPADLTSEDWQIIRVTE